MQSIIKINTDEQKPSCSICIYSRKLSGLKELSCQKRGIVFADFVCKKFSLDIMAKTARRKRGLDRSRIAQEDFCI
ncbi:MAG: hypothetical protein BWY15_00463 [Firmicutes bacterium ADurb.Bin193]|nr:MAG: hypothetical protein BWY15_00463 [Firmicutes bacterium ADurb.Bin193]